MVWLCLVTFEKQDQDEFERLAKMYTLMDPWTNEGMHALARTYSADELLSMTREAARADIAEHAKRYKTEMVASITSDLGLYPCEDPVKAAAVRIAAERARLREEILAAEALIKADNARLDFLDACKRKVEQYNRVMGALDSE